MIPDVIHQAHPNGVVGEADKNREDNGLRKVREEVARPRVDVDWVSNAIFDKSNFSDVKVWFGGNSGDPDQHQAGQHQKLKSLDV